MKPTKNGLINIFNTLRRLNSFFELVGGLGIAAGWPAGCTDPCSDPTIKFVFRSKSNEDKRTHSWTNGLPAVASQRLAFTFPAFAEAGRVQTTESK
jgi:hypothetical protein